MSEEDAALLAANRTFYQAFSSRDMAAMERVWASRAAVACLHPGWPPLLHRAGVLASWRRILGNPASPVVTCSDEQVCRWGEMGLVICQERLAEGVLIASNLFVREDGEWRMVHHQAGPLALAADPDVPHRLHS